MIVLNQPGLEPALVAQAGQHFFIMHYYFFLNAEMMEQPGVVATFWIIIKF